MILGQMATSVAINFMAKHGRGLINIALPKDHIELLGLPLMARSNSPRHDETVFTEQIEACDEVMTGISTHNLARIVAGTIEASKTDDGIAESVHVFFSQACNRWVLVRSGHTEATVDLSRLARLNLSWVICEIVSENGTMSRLPELESFTQKHRLKINIISDLIAYRRWNNNLVRVQSQSQIMSDSGSE